MRSPHSSQTAQPTAAKKIFISHSSRGDRQAEGIRDRLVSELERMRYEVLIDKTGLVAGAEWRPVIYQWLAQCDSAVVLLSVRALESMWVRRELNILLWRRARNSNFVVIPAFIEDVDWDTVIRAGFAELTQIQAARRGGDPDSTDRLVAEIIGALPSSWAEGADPISRWVGRISDHFHTVGTAKRDALRQAGLTLGISEEGVEWQHETSCRLLASQLLGRGLVDRRLERAMWDVAHQLDKTHLEALVKEAVPSWVDPEAARRLLPQQRGQEPDGMLVLIDLEDAEMVDDYLARALCRQFIEYEWASVGPIPIGEGGAEELYNAYEKAVRELLFLRTPLPPDPPRDKQKVHYLVVDPGPVRQDTALAAVRRLHSQCAWLVIVLLNRDNLFDASALARAGYSNATVVQPALARDDEIVARQLRRAIETLPNKIYGLDRKYS